MPAYISEINSNCKKQITLLIISTEKKEGWHYLSVKNPIYIIKRNNIKTSWWFLLLEFFRTENKPKSPGNACYMISMLYLRKKNLKKLSKNINYRKVRDHCYYAGKYRNAARNICNLNFNVPNEIPVVFHNGPNHDYHFILKELANESKGQFECLGENNENCKLFPFQ